jgi:hypothetical protein
MTPGRSRPTPMPMQLHVAVGDPVDPSASAGARKAGEAPRSAGTCAQEHLGLDGNSAAQSRPCGLRPIHDYDTRAVQPGPDSLRHAGQPTPGVALLRSPAMAVLRPGSATWASVTTGPGAGVGRTQPECTAPPETAVRREPRADPHGVRDRVRQGVLVQPTGRPWGRVNAMIPSKSWPRTALATAHRIGVGHRAVHGLPGGSQPPDGGVEIDMRQPARFPRGSGQR